jgi:hypothetical protein
MATNLTEIVSQDQSTFLDLDDSELQTQNESSSDSSTSNTSESLSTLSKSTWILGGITVIIKIYQFVWSVLYFTVSIIQKDKTKFKQFKIGEWIMLGICSFFVLMMFIVNVVEQDMSYGFGKFVIVFVVIACSVIFLYASKTETIQTQQIILGIRCVLLIVLYVFEHKFVEKSKIKQEITQYNPGNTLIYSAIYPII